MGRWKTMTGVALGVMALSMQTSAGEARRYNDGFYVNAKVVRVEPLLRVVRVATPREVCWDERVRHVEHLRREHRNAPLPLILGGVVGGVVGNEIGKRRNRRALTIAGTIVGAAVGHGISHEHRRRVPQSRSYTTLERHCETQTEYLEEERIDGYQVTYRYQGRHFTTRTNYDPGERLRVRVQVEPTGVDEHLTNASARRGHSRHRLPCHDGCFDT